MTTIRTHFIKCILATSLSMVGIAASAQPVDFAATPCQNYDGARHQRQNFNIAEKLVAQKNRLSITPEQEASWENYTAATLQLMEKKLGNDFAALENMTTPERIDKLDELREERLVLVEQRNTATKTLYSQLKADQKLIFDQEFNFGFGHIKSKGKHGYSKNKFNDRTNY